MTTYKVLAPCKGINRILKHGDIITDKDLPIYEAPKYIGEGYIVEIDPNKKPTTKDLSEKEMVDALEVANVAIPEKYTRQQLEKLYDSNKGKLAQK